MAKPKSKSKPKASAKAKAAAKAKPAAKARPAAKAKPVDEKTGHPGTRSTGARPAGPVFRGLRTVIYQVDDLARAKTFYSAATGLAPYFDEPFYVGYDVAGFELGLDPDLSKRRPGAGGTTAYWRVDDIVTSHDFLLALGAKSIEAPHNVGGAIEVAVLADPFGNQVGLIQEA
jgi:predicted enzyme related to lactoylglutathione lyase